MEATPLVRLARPFRIFARLEASSGILLLLGLATALAWANSPASGAYFHLLETPLSLGLGPWSLTGTLHHFINDGLMSVFFFVVGLEIKREMVAGELAGIKRAAFPAFAALGGMAAPALIYAACNLRGGDPRGWGIPMATDIPFALGILALLGNRIPPSLKVFLMALAIIDDLGAVLVITLFYSQAIAWPALGAAAGVVALLIGLNRLGARSAILYVLPGFALWALLQRSGIHGTLAGVLTAWCIPARARVHERDFAALGRSILARFEAAAYREETPLLNPERLDAVSELQDACEKVEPPLQRLEEAFHPWTSYLILPLFAWANAGVRVDAGLLASLAEPAGFGIVLGLVAGKPLGILAATGLMRALGFPPLSGGVGGRHMLGAGLLGGIGFTMSIFISGLAFGEGRALDAAKVAVFLASALAGLLGYLCLRGAPRVPTEESP